MIQCPKCDKGLLWGIYLDVPPEMKAGVAEWVGCDPPDHDEAVTCPHCGETAGKYGRLFQADAENRKEDRARERALLFEQIAPTRLPTLHVLGCEFTGNYNRESFLNHAWKTLHQWLQVLRKEKIITRALFRDLPEDFPNGIGVRLDHPSQTNPIQCRYLVAVPIAPLEGKIPAKLAERLQHPQYNDPKNTKVLHISEGFFSKQVFQGLPENFFPIDKFTVKEWLPEKRFELREAPCLEFYSAQPENWPPQKGIFEVAYHVPIAPLPAEIPQEEMH